MPDRYTYLLVDLGCILFPFLFSFHPRFRFISQWRYFFLPCLLTAVFFLGWDALFTSLHVWSFNPRYVIGAYLYNLPVEECLFFIFIPYACVFTFYCIDKYIKLTNGPATRIVTIALIVLLSIIALFHLQQLYTSVTFLLLSALLTFLLLRRASFLPAFYISYLLILLPFFISNGILTGSFIKEPVVMYDNTYNLSVRMFTIPVEDAFYGMFLLLLNVSGYQYLRKRSV